MSPSSIGVNLRVTGHCNQGGRKYMEDVFSVAYQQTEDEKDLEYAFFGIFDGHGGREAALFAKEHLMDSITKQKNFWSDVDELVLKAIRDGFLATQQAMWKDLANWRPTASGLPSTAGTTASVCFIKRGKLFVGHCGDSGIVLGEQDPEHPGRWRARPLTKDHKPESEAELSRITQSGGKVVKKSGVPRVVWYRPRVGHHGPVRRSTPIDEVPFLAVARALGDLWSYNAEDDVFVVSPDPDLHVYDLSVLKDRCLILATDGAWNVLSPDMAVQCVYNAERNNERHMINPQGGSVWINPSKKLVDLAIDRWNMCKLRADNTSIVTVMLDPPGPPRAQVLRRLHGVPAQQPLSAIAAKDPPALPPKPAQTAQTANKGIAIISRFPNSRNEGEKHGTNLVGDAGNGSGNGNEPAAVTRIVHDSLKSAPHKLKVALKSPQPQLPKSPSPPPLPIRPANLKKFTTANAAYTRTRNRSGCQPLQPAAPASPTPPALPVKQPRRSIVPEYNSDSENHQPQPKQQQQQQPPLFCRSTRRSCGQLKASITGAANPLKPLPMHQGKSMPQQRRSEPVLPAPPPPSSPTLRVLRPRNKEEHVEMMLQQRVQTRSRDVFQSQADPNASGGVKRKRRSFESVPTKLSRPNVSKHVRSCTWSKGGVVGGPTVGVGEQESAAATAAKRVSKGFKK